MPKITDDGGYLLPTIINPPERICIMVEVPNDPNHLLAFWGALSELGYWWNWQRDPLKQGALVAEVWREVIEEARICYLELLPMSICQLINITNEQSITNEYLARQAQRVSNNNRYTTVYDGTPTSINPNVPATFQGANSTSNNALCNAVNQYVRVKMLEGLNLVRSLSGVGFAATAALGLLTGGLGFLIGGVTLLLPAVTLVEYENAAADNDALDAVICDLDNLLTGSITQAAFTNAINALTSTNGTTRDTIVDMLKQGSADLLNYLYFLDLLGTAQGLAASGVYVCPCVAVSYIVTYDAGSYPYTIGRSGTLGLTGGMSNSAALYSTVVGNSAETWTNVPNLPTHNGLSVRVSNGSASCNLIILRANGTTIKVQPFNGLHNDPSGFKIIQTTYPTFETGSISVVVQTGATAHKVDDIIITGIS